MNKLFFILVFSVLFSCSSSDDTPNNNVNSFSPPTWIIGTWLNQEDFDLGIPRGFKFTNQQYCQILLTSNNCLDGTLITEESKTESDYKFSYGISSLSTNLHFRKLNNNQIQVLNSIGVVQDTFTKQ